MCKNKFNSVIYLCNINTINELTKINEANTGTKYTFCSSIIV